MARHGRSCCADLRLRTRALAGDAVRAEADILANDAHGQHAHYAARRTTLRSALGDAGFRVDHSEASLYLWATRGEDCWQTVAWLADRGILAAPGTFYGGAGAEHVRVALTANDERIEAAAGRLRESAREAS